MFKLLYGSKGPTIKACRDLHLLETILPKMWYIMQLECVSYEVTSIIKTKKGAFGKLVTNI